MNMNPFEMMKNLGMIENQMKIIKDKLASLTATGSAGAGLVEVTINGEYSVQKISINPVILDPKEKETVEVLMRSAFNDATVKMRELTEEFTKKQLLEMGGQG